MLNKNVETFIGCDCEYKDAEIVIFGAPFDSTTSFRPGTRFAAKAMRGDSFGIETYSPYQDKDLIEDCRVMDSGDLELAFGNTEKALAAIFQRTKTILASNKRPIMIGGEHLVTLGAIRAVVEKYPDINIIHFDAHTDLRDDYLGEKLSHSTVIRRCHDIVGDKRIFQFGIRSGEKNEFEFAKKHNFINRFNLNGLSDIVKKLEGKPVYFTLDLDVLDPSCFCGTGTPEAGGITFLELLDGVKMISKLNVVACDINELSPIYDQSGASTALACKITREIIIAISNS